MKQIGRHHGGKIRGWIIAVSIMTLIGVLISLAAWCYQNIKDKSEYRTQGIAQYEKGDYQQAVVDFQASLGEKACFTDELDKDTRYYLADSYFLLEQYEAAIQQYDTLLKYENVDKTYLEQQRQVAQGFLDLKNRNYENAFPAFEAAVENGHLECALYAGICAAELNRQDKMVAYLTMYLSANPESAYACTQLADYYLQQGLYDTCYQYLQQGLQSTDRSCDEQLLLIEVVYYEYQHDYNKAYELICSYMQMYPVTEMVQKEYDFLYTRQTLE